MSYQEYDIELPTLEETREFASSLAGQVTPGTILALHGDLGAGKTTLVQFICQSLGVTAPVDSPTFVLMQEYSGKIPIVHIDLYRIKDPEETVELGFGDFLDNSLTLIEWPEIIEHMLPDETIHIELGFLEKGRRLRIRIPSGLAVTF